MPRTNHALALAAAFAGLALTGATAGAASIGDLNGDGNDDILLRNADGRWLYNAMEGRRRIANLSGFADLPSDWSWHYQGMGDFDGDGSDDVLLRHDNGRWYVYHMDGRDAPDQGTRLAMYASQDWQLAAIGDLNGDLTDDVLLRHRKNGRWYYYPVSDGAVASGRGTAGLTSNQSWQFAGLGDLDGDGNDDVLLRHTDGRWWYYPMNGRRHFASGRGLVDIETSEAWQLAGIGDFDGDGGGEMLLRHTDGRWQYYGMNGRHPDPDDQGVPRITRNTDFDFAGIGDLNGDGNDDVLLRRSTGHWYYYPMSGRNFIAGRGTTNVTARLEWRMADAATDWDPTEFYVDDYNQRFKNSCAVPRSGVDQRGTPFPDRQGSTLDENNWLRSWSHDTYLWYDEIEDVDPACCDTAEYFGRLKTFATTPSGRPRDDYHYTQDTAERLARILTGSVGAGYGAQFFVLRGRTPRDIRVAYTEPDSPATSTGVNLLRGTEILEVDGVDVVNGPTQADVDVINAALWPQALGETHEFVVRDPGSTLERRVTMTSADITTVPVQHVLTIDTETGPVGYLLNNTFGVQTGEGQMFDAFETLAAAGVKDLIVDLRYNGGGYVILANQLGYMVGGSRTSNQVFNQIQFNDKHRAINPVTGERLEPDLFYRWTIGWSSHVSGTQLPTLDLDRVFILGGDWTCSASELVINALRGVDIEVVLIGETTCGKPYGFYPQDNCGTTYSTVQFRGVNAKNFGDYSDGFSPANLGVTAGVSVPGCSVADDFEHQFGDPEEARVAAALQYRRTGTCPPPTGVAEHAATEEEQSGLIVSDPTPRIGEMIPTPVDLLR